VASLHALRPAKHSDRALDDPSDDDGDDYTVESIAHSRDAQSSIRAEKTRLALICALFVGCAVVLVWRLYTLQVREGVHYQELGDAERRAEIPIAAKRGSLLDTNGNPLAITVRYDSVYAIGSLIGDLDLVATQLSPVLEVPPPQLRALLEPKAKQPVVLRHRVPAAVAEQVKQLELPGVYLDAEPIRQYPEGSLAAQVLGFVGHDFDGLGGLELSFDHELAGTPGTIDTERDTSGQEISLARRLLTPPQEGADLVLTLDRYVQRVAERLLNQAVLDNKASGGLILVEEAGTGNILAAANSPTYDLTAEEIFDPRQADRYKSKIVTDQYEPGSTMKTIAMASAIDQGVVTPGAMMNDVGSINVAGTIIRNWNFAANGPSTMTEVLIHSSNVGMSWLSGQLGPDRLYAYYARFGFGEPTGVRLPGEVAGTMRTPSDPTWTRIDLATNAFGQGIAVTPMQLLQAVSVLANDGQLVRPRLVRAMRAADGSTELAPEVVRQVVTEKTARTLRQMMVAVHEQEALQPYRVAGYHIAAKTGTADTPTNVGYNTALTVGSLVAIVPAEQPRFVVLIRLDGPERLYGGVVAAPVLKELAQELVTYYRVPPTT
jgi:cell division protein FtsI/penicillin-binding protein 2